MSLPRIRPTPHLEKLLAPDEVIIYTASLHPFYGLGWLAGALLALAASYYLSPWFLLTALPLLVIYVVPFQSNEFAVTTHRLLIRYGRFKLALNDIDPAHLDHYQLHQNVIDVWTLGGTLILNLKSAGGIHTVHLRHLWMPMRFVEALCTLNPNLR